MKFKKSLQRLILIVNRFSHFIDIALFFFISDLVYKTTSNNLLRICIYIVPIVQTIRALKWEWRIHKSNMLIRNTALSGRVQAFSGKQGAGKTSFMLYSLAVLKCKSVYSNFPCKIRNKFVKTLESDILNLDTRIPDGSVTVIDEATLLYHNLVIEPRKLKQTHPELYAQAVCQQLVRHFFDGNMFYSSVDITRLPQFLKDNIGLTNFMLGRGSVTLSFFTGLLCGLLGRLIGLDVHGAVMYWDVQQLERIPEQGYVFDLSTQEKDTNDNNFANLIRFCGFQNPLLFDYDDRFMRGVYSKLPPHADRFWETLEFSEKDLRRIGYGELLDFFNSKKFDLLASVNSDNLKSS